MHGFDRAGKHVPGDGFCAPTWPVHVDSHIAPLLGGGGVGTCVDRLIQVAGREQWGSSKRSERKL